MEVVPNRPVEVIAFGTALGYWRHAVDPQGVDVGFGREPATYCGQRFYPCNGAAPEPGTWDDVTCPRCRNAGLSVLRRTGGDHVPL